MKAIQFSILAIIVIMITASGCYKYGEETDNVSMSDIFGEDEVANAALDEEPIDDDESPLSKILNKKKAEAEAEEEIEAEEEPEEEESEEEVDEEDEADTSVPKKVFKEGDEISFANLKKVDADGDKITYTFTEPLDENGEWQTEEGDAGEYVVTITASDGKSEVAQKLIIVVEGLNARPVIDIDDITVEEGETVKLEPEVTDEDDDPIEIEYSGWMDSDEYKTDYDDSGKYTVTIKASDGKVTVSKDVVVTVKDNNRKPILDNIQDIEVTEGELVAIEVEAVDPDRDTITFTYDEPLDEDGEWQTTEGDAGEYDVTVTVSDGELKDTEKFTITVVTSNARPTLSVVVYADGDRLAASEWAQVGDEIELRIETDDADGDDVEVEITGWMTTESKVATEGGEFEVVVTASDGEKEIFKTLTIKVNTPPSIDF